MSPKTPNLEGISEVQFRALLEAAPDAVVIVDEKAHIKMVNAQALKWFGYGREELIGQPIEILVPAGLRKDHVGMRNQYLANPQTRPLGAPGLELNGQRKDGTHFPVEISLSPLKTEEGLLVTSVIRDVSRRKEVELELERYRNHLEELVRKRTQELEKSYDRLRETEKLAAVGELAAKIAHEIKNPITGIYAACQILYRGIDPADPKREIFENMMTEIRRLDETVQDLLEFARPKPPQMTETDVQGFFKGLIEPLKRREDVSRHKILNNVRKDLVLMLDTRLMGQVFSNMILNAAQAMDQPGKIEITSTEDGGKVTLQIADNGPGIPQEKMKSIFEPFFTTKSRGTGLGLAIARKNVEAHQGSIEVTSRPGLGTSFQIHLPRT